MIFDFLQIYLFIFYILGLFLVSLSLAHKIWPHNFAWIMHWFTVRLDFILTLVLHSCVALVTVCWGKMLQNFWWMTSTEIQDPFSLMVLVLILRLYLCVLKTRIIWAASRNCRNILTRCLQFYGLKFLILLMHPMNIAMKIRKHKTIQLARFCNPSLSVDGFDSLGCSNMIVFCVATLHSLVIWQFVMVYRLLSHLFSIWFINFMNLWCCITPTFYTFYQGCVTQTSETLLAENISFKLCSFYWKNCIHVHRQVFSLVLIGLKTSYMGSNTAWPLGHDGNSGIYIYPKQI